jgi:two-component system copper resistance phosphate regulon response regulator CusR
MSVMRILFVEDDRKIAASVSKSLRAESFAVDVAPDGQKGEELANINEYDVIILDVMMPKQDGWTTCKNLRQSSILTPILMLTALDDVDCRIKGLDTGADDYLTKPFHFGELVARIRSLVRRGTTTKSAVLEKFGIRLDLNTHHATRDGQEIALTAKEFALLEYFMLNPDVILSKEKISEHVCDMNFEPKSNVIESFIKFLRQKVDKGFDHPLIHTVRGSGYVFSERQP